MSCRLEWGRNWRVRRQERPWLHSRVSGARKVSVCVARGGGIYGGQLQDGAEEAGRDQPVQGLWTLSQGQQD